MGLAIDVSVYNGHQIWVHQPNSLTGITDLIRNLPAGEYNLGLPRPPQETEADRRN
jgi:hypothetical protein